MDDETIAELMKQLNEQLREAEIMAIVMTLDGYINTLSAVDVSAVGDMSDNALVALGAVVDAAWNYYAKVSKGPHASDSRVSDRLSKLKALVGKVKAAVGAEIHKRGLDKKLQEYKDKMKELEGERFPPFIPETPSER